MGQTNGRSRRVGVASLIPKSVIVVTTKSVVPTSVHVVRTGSLFMDRSSLAKRSSPVRGHPRTGKGGRDGKDMVRLRGVYFVKSGMIDKSTANVIFTANGDACLNAVTHDVTKCHTTATFSGKVDGIDFLLVQFVLVVVPFIFLMGNIAGNS